MDEVRSRRTDRQTDGKRRKVREMMKTAKRVEARRGMFILPAIM